MRRSVLFFSFLVGLAACSSDPGSSSAELGGDRSATDPPVATAVPPPDAVLHDGELVRPKDGSRPGEVPAFARRTLEPGSDEHVSVLPCERLRLCGAGLETAHIDRP